MVEVAVIDSSRELEEVVLDVEGDDDFTAACLFEKKELSTVIVRFFMSNPSLSLSSSHELPGCARYRYYFFLTEKKG